MIEIRDGVYFSRFFFVDANSRNTMGALMRETPDGPFVIHFRFRHYMDRKVFDSEDVRSWKKMDIPDEAAGLRAITALCSALHVADEMDPDGIKPPDIVVVESDDAATVMAILGSRPWAKCQPAPLTN